MKLHHAIGLFIVLTALSNAAVAQQEFLGTIVGMARDPSGAAVPDVAVVARNVGTGVERSTKTSAAGQYTFHVAVGEYELTATRAGFQTLTTTGVRVVSGIALTVDLNLVVGAVTQTIEVQGTLSKVDTVSNSTGTTETLEEISKLPLPMIGGQGGPDSQIFLC